MLYLALVCLVNNMTNDEKWKSPMGHSISSSETDKLTPEDKKLNLPDEVTIYQSDLGGIGKLNMFVPPLSGEYIEKMYVSKEKADNEIDKLKDEVKQLNDIIFSYRTATDKDKEALANRAFVALTGRPYDYYKEGSHGRYAHAIFRDFSGFIFDTGILKEIE